MKWYRNLETGEYRQFEKDPGDGWEQTTATEAVLDRISKGEKIAAEEMEKIRKMVADEMQQLRDEFEARLRKRPIVAGEDGVKPVSIAKCIRGFFHGDWSKADYERDLVNGEFKERATTLSNVNDSYGGFIVPPEYLGSEFVEMLYSQTGALQAGVRTITASGGPVIIPTHQTGATAYWIGDDVTAITASDQTFGQKTAQPHPLAALCRVSNALLRDSNPSVEAIIRSDIAKTLGIALDAAILKGTGASGQPIGIMKTTGTTDIATSAALVPDYIWDTIYQIENAKVPFVGGAIMLSPKQWNELLQAADGAGTPKYSVDVYPNIGKSFAGGTIPIVTTHNLAAAESITGVFSECLLVQWGGLEFAASEHASDGTNHAFVTNTTFIRAIMTVDVVVRQPKAFCWNDNWS